MQQEVIHKQEVGPSQEVMPRQEVGRHWHEVPNTGGDWDAFSLRSLSQISLESYLPLPKK